MGFRFRRTKKILPGVRLNIGKRGMSISLGPRGLKHTISTTGRATTTAGIPGSGLSYSKANVPGKTSIQQSDKERRNDMENTQKVKKPFYKRWWFVLICVILVLGAIGNGISGSNDGQSGQTGDSANDQVSDIAATKSPPTDKIVEDAADAGTPDESEVEPISESTNKTEESAPTFEAPADTNATTPSEASEPAQEPTSDAVAEPPPVTLAMTSAPSTVHRNEDVTISVTGKPNTEYRLRVFYQSESNADGLGAKTSDENGRVSWTWQIGGKTSLGDFHATIIGGGEEIRHDFTVVE